MIHVCSLARLHATVETTGAGHVVTLLKDTDRVERPRTVLEANHLILGMDDIGLTLRNENKISDFEAKRKREMPWA